MKKLVLLGAFALSAFSANAQWTEDFDSGTDLPEGWVVINDGDDNGFVFGVPSVGSTHSGGNVAKIFYSYDAHDDYLITKAIEVNAGVSDRISFWLRNRSSFYADECTVLLSTTDQSKEAFTVELLGAYEPPTTWEKKEFDLSAYDGQTVYVAVHATSANKYELYVDSFVVDSPVSCETPENISNSNVDITTADISWNASTSTVDVGYQVYYSTDESAPSDTTNLDSTNSVSVGATETTANLTNLEPETTYYAWVRANCATDDNSAWSISTTFTTKASCQVPTNLNATDITTTSATISWHASPTPVNIAYEMYYSTDNTAPDASTVLDSTNSVTTEDGSTLSVEISNLTANTTYYVWVRAHCSTDDYSDWSTKKIFKTACEAFTTNYLENFDTATTSITPDCWLEAKGGNPSTGPNSIGSSYWFGKDFLNDDSNTKAMVINLYTDYYKEWLISPTFDLSGGTNFELKFDYGVTKYNQTIPMDMGSDDSVQVLVSTDGGSTWTVVHTWNTSNQPTNTSNVFTFDLTPYISSETRVAFYGTDGTVNDTEDYDFFIENFEIVDTSNAGTINNELSGLNVYPNPVSDVLTITNDTAISTVEVFDVNGRRLVNEVANATSTTINVSSFATGTYFVKVTADGKTSTKQIVVK